MPTFTASYWTPFSTNVPCKNIKPEAYIGMYIVHPVNKIYQTIANSLLVFSHTLLYDTKDIYRVQ
jgi:hypothetical protein